MAVVSKLESINGIIDLVVIRECESDSFVDELCVKFEFFDIAVFVYEIDIDDGFRNVCDSISKVCMVDIVGIVCDFVIEGSFCIGVVGEFGESSGNMRNFLDYIEMSVDVVLFDRVKSENDFENISSLSVCLDIYVESIVFGFIELIGKLIESVLDGVFFLFIKKIVDSNIVICLDFELSMLDVLDIFLESVLGSDLDIIEEMIEVLYDLKIVEEFKIKEEDYLESVVCGILFFDLFVEIFVDLKIIDIFYI